MRTQWVTAVLTFLKHTDGSVEHHEHETCVKHLQGITNKETHTHKQTNRSSARERCSLSSSREALSVISVRRESYT